MQYDGIFIFDSNISQEQTKKVTQGITDCLQKLNGSVQATQDWGRRRMAHAIKDKKDGTYLLVEFELRPESMDRFQSLMRLNEQILKFMVTRKTKIPRRRIRVRKPKAASVEPSTA